MREMEAGETASRRQGEEAVTGSSGAPGRWGGSLGTSSTVMCKTVLTEGTGVASRGTHPRPRPLPKLPGPEQPLHSRAGGLPPGSPERWAFDLGQVLEMTLSSLYGRSNRTPRDQRTPAGGPGQWGSPRATSLPRAKRPGPAAPLGAESDLLK